MIKGFPLIFLLLFYTTLLKVRGIGISLVICDMIKGNESLVDNFKFYFLTPHSCNFKMLHFNANPITIGNLVTEL